MLDIETLEPEPTQPGFLCGAFENPLNALAVAEYDAPLQAGISAAVLVKKFTCGSSGHALAETLMPNEPVRV